MQDDCMGHEAERGQKVIEKKGVYGSGMEHLKSGTVGAYQELREAADLLSKGYDVFRAVSPSCTCDLIALNSSVAIKVEVRTGHINAKGEPHCPQYSFRADCFAIALRDKIVYKPNLFSEHAKNGLTTRKRPCLKPQ